MMIGTFTLAFFQTRSNYNDILNSVARENNHQDKKLEENTSKLVKLGYLSKAM